MFLVRMKNPYNSRVDVLLAFRKMSLGKACALFGLRELLDTAYPISSR